jgi:hypothetical protein
LPVAHRIFFVDDDHSSSFFHSSSYYPRQGANALPPSFCGLHALHAGQAYPVVPFPSLKTLVIRCSLGPWDTPKVSTDKYLLHECIDLLTPLSPSNIVFQGTDPSEREYVEIRQAVWLDLLHSPTWSALETITYLSTYVRAAFLHADDPTLDERMEERYGSLHRIWDYSVLAGWGDKTGSFLGMVLEDECPETDRSIVLRNDQVGRHRMIEDLDELDGFEVVFND